MENLTQYLPYITGALAVGCGSYAIYKKFLASPRKRICGKDYPRDVVIVHQEGCGPYAPSLSPYVIKLLIFLRLSKIPHQIDARLANLSNGPKHAIPWIEYNGDVLGDSHLIMEYLSKKFDVDIDAGLDKRQKAEARSLVVWVENFLYWLMVHTRWVILIDDFFNYCKFGLGSFVKWSIRSENKKKTYSHGIGRHSDREIHEFMKNELQSLSDHLGNKDYFMGSKITSVDCAIFGQLSQIHWHMPESCPGKVLLEDKLTNLTSYCERIKNQVFPDWEQLKERSEVKGKTFCQKTN